MSPAETATLPATLPAIWPDADPVILAPVAEHEDLRAVARALVAKRGAPGEAPADGTLWRQLTGELDVAGIAVPEALGGSGFGLRELAVVLEEAGAGLVGEPLLSSAALGTHALTLAEDPGVVAGLRARAVAGEALLTVWFGRGEGLELVEDGERVVLRGELDRVLDGARAGHVVALAGAEPALVAAEVAPGAAEALTCIDESRPQALLRLGEAPATVLARGVAARQAWRRLEAVRDVAVGAEHAGIVARLLDLTVEHVTTREQFGRPIGSFQAIKHRLADVLVARERCYSAVRYAAALYDTDPDGAATAAAVAAAVTADAVVATAHEAVQLHGGIGFTWEHVAHRYLRRALGDEGLFGSARDHRARVAGFVGLGAGEL